MTDEKKNPLEVIAGGGKPPPPEERNLKSWGNAGAMRVMYVIPASKLVSQKSTLDILVQLSAEILNIAAWSPSFGNNMIAELQNYVDGYLDRIAQMLPPPPEEDDEPPAS